MDGLLALGCALVCTVSLSAQTNPPAGAQTNRAAARPDAQRYLFIVDTSASMRKIDDGTRQAVFDLVYFGIGGQMKNGDTFGIWTFNEKPFAGQVPMQIWDSEKVLVQASLAAKHLKAQKLEGKSNPQAALARSASVVRNVKDVNILLITDGETPLEGTTFDPLVNPVFDQRSREREKLKKPFIATFIARGGQVTNVSVVLAGEPISIPPPSPPSKELVLQPKPAATNIARVAPRVTRIRKTNSTPLIVRGAAPRANAGGPASESTSTNAQAAAETPGLVVHPADYIGSNEALGFMAKTSAAPNAAKTSGSNVVTNVVRAAAAATPNVAAPLPVPAPVSAPGTTTAANVERVARATNRIASMFSEVPVAARELQSAGAAPAVPRSGLSPAVLIVAGVLLLAASVGLLLFGFWRSRTAAPRPSFISQSMERR